MNLPAQRLHTVFKLSHSLAKLFFATTVMSREQETGTEAAASHRDRAMKDRATKYPRQINSEILFPVPVQEFIFIPDST